MKKSGKDDMKILHETGEIPKALSDILIWVAFFCRKKNARGFWLNCIPMFTYIHHWWLTFQSISTHWFQPISLLSCSPSWGCGTWLILPFLKRNMIPTRMSQEVSKWLGSVGYKPNICHLEVGYNPLTDLLLTSWDIQVRTIIFLQQLPVVHFQTVTVV